ncbi:MAG: MarR family transcriptional regulator [Cyclobacteriaceae bacterium]|nr:MarR family transcriptional regulator [Cyclobacteriaceae bacterium]
MEGIKLTDLQKTLVEKLGVVFEHAGSQPAPSRVLSLLLVADNTELTFDEIWQTLKISKSAASNAINLLLTTNKIEYITRTGNRKRYFRSRITSWREEMRNSLHGLLHVSKLYQEVLDQRPKSTKEFNASLKDVIEFTEFLHQELDSIFLKWELRKKK